jgi:hypothetical protein
VSLKLGTLSDYQLSELAILDDLALANLGNRSADTDIAVLQNNPSRWTFFRSFAVRNFRRVLRMLREACDEFLVVS